MAECEASVSMELLYSSMREKVCNWTRLLCNQQTLQKVFGGLVAPLLSMDWLLVVPSCTLFPSACRWSLSYVLL